MLIGRSVKVNDIHFFYVFSEKVLLCHRFENPRAVHPEIHREPQVQTLRY